MENREQQILSEIKSMMSSIRTQLEALDAKMAELQNLVGNEGMEEAPIDLDLDVFPDMEPAEEPHEESVEDLPSDDLPFDDDLQMFAEPEPEPLHEPAASVPEVKPAVIDAMAEKQAWRTDMPGGPVRDIRSAISLNDRILFINTLFGQDPMAFQDALTRINQMESLDAVVEYVHDEHPDWDLDSEVVYRFMMAVRRRIR